MRLALIIVNIVVCIVSSEVKASVLPQVFKVDIAAATRHDALIELATQTDYEILFSPDAIPPGKIEALRGDYSFIEALAVLLEDSDFEYRLTGKQVRIVRTEPKSAALPKITVQGYLRDASSRISQDEDSQDRFPLYQVPLSIQSISRDHIEDVLARDLGDIVLYVGGVDYFEPSSGFRPSYYSRGIITPFSIDGKFYRRSVLELDSAVIERIDLIQGPSANYLKPGGMLNFVTRKPNDESQTSLNLIRGSEDLYRGEMDINLAFGSDAKHAVRVIAVGEKEDHFKRFAYSEKYVVAPSIDITVAEQTQLLISVYHQVEEKSPNTLTYHESLLGKRLPQDQLLGLPWANTRTEATTFSVDLSTRDWGGWQVSAGTNWSVSDTDIEMTAWFPFPDPEAPFLVYIYQKDNVTKSHGFDASAERGISIFDHSALFRVGFDYQYYDQSRPNHGGGDVLGLVDIYQPDYSIPKPLTPPGKIGYYEQLTDFFGVNLALSYYFSDDLVLYSDLRYEDMRLDGTLSQTTPATRWRLKGRYKELTPQLGLNNAFSDSFSMHISYSESFTHQGVIYADDLMGDDGSPDTSEVDSDFVDPAKNRQYELALKKKWLGGGLSSSLTFYKIKQANILTLNNINQMTGVPAPDEPYKNEVADDQRSQGVSLNIVGWLNENMNIIANASYNDNTLSTRGVPGPVSSIGFSAPAVDSGKRLHGTAKNVANIWLNYAAKHGVLKDFRFGFGVNYVGTRYGSDANDFSLDSYTKADTTIKYTGFSNVTVGLSVRNIFDKFYYNSSLGNDIFVEEGEPRNYSLSIKTTRGF